MGKKSLKQIKIKSSENFQKKKKETDEKTDMIYLQSLEGTNLYLVQENNWTFVLWQL